MTARIYVNIEADTAIEARHEMERLLGPLPTASEYTAKLGSSIRAMIAENEVEDPPAPAEPELAQAPDTAAKAGTRKRGEPSPGKKRRTAAEIAEDEAAEKAELDSVSNQVIPAISETPEDRQDPNNPDDAPTDSAEDAAQDAADEAAETAAAKEATGGKPTLDDIRTVLGNYQKVYGLPATMEDGPKVLAEVCGEGVVKVSAVPEDKIADVIAALKKAGKENRFGRTATVVVS